MRYIVGTSERLVGKKFVEMTYEQSVELRGIVAVVQDSPFRRSGHLFEGDVAFGLRSEGRHTDFVRAHRLKHKATEGIQRQRNRLAAVFSCRICLGIQHELEQPFGFVVCEDRFEVLGFVGVSSCLIIDYAQARGAVGIRHAVHPVDPACEIECHGVARVVGQGQRPFFPLAPFAV